MKTSILSLTVFLAALPLMVAESVTKPNILVIFTDDHGWTDLGAQGVRKDIRTPWLAYWKGTIPGGQAYPHAVISLDVAATAVALAGLKTQPAELDGKPLRLLPGRETRSQPCATASVRGQGRAT